MTARNLRIAIAALICCFVISDAQAQQAIKIRFGKLPVSLAPARMSLTEEMGFFKKHGIEIETTEFRASPELNTAIVSGAIDIAASGLVPVITARQRNLPVKAFFVEANSAFYYLLASPSIASLQDAVDKGASVAVSGIGSTDHFVARYIVRKAGLDANKLRYIQSGVPGQRVAALEAGRVDIAIGGIPESFTAVRGGKVKELARMADYAEHFALETLWAREDFIEKNPEAIRRFLAAMDEAATWIHTSPDAPAAIAKYLGLSGPGAIDDVKQALAVTSFPTVAQHKARLADLLLACEPLAIDALERGVLKADSPAAAVLQFMDLRYVQ